jgi:hypothetical protein
MGKVMIRDVNKILLSYRFKDDENPFTTTSTKKSKFSQEICIKFQLTTLYADARR